MHASAPAPTRSTSTQVLAWGLINIPVSLYAASDETRVARREFTNDGNPVGRQSYDKVTGTPVLPADVVRMAESDSGALVELTDDEIAAVTSRPDGVAEIHSLISLDSLHRDFVVEKHYQVRPKSEKKGAQAAEKSFALLTAALAARDSAALVKLAVRGPAKWAAVTPDGRLLILAYVDAVRAPRPMPSVTVSDAELALALKLLDTIPAADPSTMTDETSAAVRAYVNEKAERLLADGTIVEPARPAPAPTADAVDLLAQLEASLAATKAA